MDVGKAYEADNGFLVTDGPFYTGGALSPVGLGLPSNTIYVQTLASGILVWQKFGAGDTASDWRIYPASGVSFDVSSLTGNSLDLVGLSQVQQVVSALANRHFGKQFQPAFTAADLTTTSTTFIDIQTLTTPSLPSGNYLAIGYASYQKTLLAGQIQTRIFLNNTTEFGLAQVSMDDDDFWFHSTTFAYLPGISGVNTVDLQMRKSNGGGDILTRNRLLLFVRVS